MSNARCGSCSADLSVGELDDGWCSACGKAIAGFVYREAGLKGRKEKALPRAQKTATRLEAPSADPDDAPAKWQLALIGAAMVGIAVVIVLAFL